MFKDKLILTDCDGVLLDWEYHFDKWMLLNDYKIWNANSYNVAKKYDIPRELGKTLVKVFNESAEIGWLSPLNDSIKYVKKLHEEHGYTFHCITSLSTNKYAKKLREQNLNNLFGSAIEQVICLPCGARKDKFLKQHYNNIECYWIEDKIENAKDGIDAGLNSILYAHNHNSEYIGNIPRLNSWKEIYQHISGV